MASVTLEQVTKVYPNGHAGVRDLDLAIDDGEFVVLVGPSGCGKSTALRMIAGLEQITSGVLTIGDQVVNDLPPKDRDIAMVFQNYALYPHMTVAANIGFALKLQGLPKKAIADRVHKAAATLQLEPWLDRKPGQLSGGQRQRVAMGRAIVRDPAVFLMDEPLSNLDAKLRVQMRAEIAHLQRDLKTTTIYVTHDQVEAMTMGDRVAVLRDGRLQQIAPPEVLYAEPGNVFVAAFIGSPAMNLLAAEVEQAAAGIVLVLGEQRIELPASATNDRPGLASYVGRGVVLGIRPEHLSDAGIDGATAARLRAEVELRESLGSELHVHLAVDAPPAITDDTRAAADLAAGDVELAERVLDRRPTTTLIARFDARSRVRVGDVVEVAVATDRLHFFDPASGRSIR